ncbi:enoyl-CoA hydratase [Parvularcula marina]|uniref:Enoyl-CoA hydratase n=1 Tax=Parvularcula marina TaxID=2292771 RepID=A0A371RLC3_9PROT|nr:enoyl-CoA hydratase [Parvularcula marina]RFB06272.1 enoyl-CoA hydratase [Parvularcula marina]
MTDRILTKKDGQIGHLIFNNPDKLNAISLDMWEGMGKAVDAFEKDDDIRVIVCSGAGGKSFIAGADVSKYEEERMGENAQEHYAKTGERALSALYNSTKVTIAAIDGWCIGGGISVAVSCDLRYCSTKSEFAQPAMRYGIGYRYGSLRRLVDIVGVPTTKEMLLGGRRLKADEAYTKGLVGKVIEEADYQAFIDDIAGKIAIGAPLTAQQVKFTLGEIVKDPSDRDLERCEAMFQTCYASADYKEGIRAFSEKRKPVFTGK